MEDDCFQEEEDDDDDDDDDEEEGEESEPISENEKELLRAEFLSSICSQFIEGKDKDFDYR